MQNVKILLISSILTPLLCLSNLSFAKENDQYQTITVVATKTARDNFAPPSMSLVESKTSAQNFNAQTLPEMLKNVNGVDFTGGPLRNGNEPRMRGYSSNGIIILLDGTRQNFNSGHSGRLFLEPELLKQVDVVKGSQSSTYGSGGLGGVMSFTTKDASDMLEDGKKHGYNLKSSYSSVSNESSVSASSFAVNDKMDIISNVVYRDSGNLKLGNGQTLTNTSDKIWSGLTKVNYKIDDKQSVKLNLQGSDIKSKEFANPQQSNGQDSAFLTDKTTKVYTASLGYKYNAKNDKLNIETNLYNTKTSIDYIRTGAPTGQSTTSVKTLPIGSGRDRSYNTIGFDIQNTSKIKIKDRYKNTLVYGLNYFRDSQDASSNGASWSLVPQGVNKVYGLFAQNEIDIKTNIGSFILLPALRYDRYISSSSDVANSKDTNSAFSPKIGITYKPQDWVMTFINYSYGFRAPNITEKYANGQHYNAGFYVNNFIPNSHLKAERNRTLEGGFGFDFKDKIQKSDRLTFKTSAYYTQSYNFINQVIDDSAVLPKMGNRGPVCNMASSSSYYNPSCWTGSGVTQYLNVDRAIIKGFDIDLKYQSSNFNADIGYAEVNAYEKTSGKQLFSSVPKTLKAGIHYNINDFTIGWRGAFVKSFDYTTTNSAYEVNPKLASAGQYFSPARSGYSLHDVYAQYFFKKNTSINIGVDNIFNKGYRVVNTANYQPARSYKAGFAVNF